MAIEKIPLIVAIIVVIIIYAVTLTFLGIVKKACGPETNLPVIAEEIYGLSGEIKGIKDRVLLVEAKILLVDPTKEPIKRIVRVKVTDETKILKLKFPEEIPTGIIGPIIPEETEVGISDLKAGDKIDVETTGNISENIKNNAEIAVKIINIIEYIE